jgi:hypothetical protein
MNGFNDLPDRFKDKVEADEHTGCWEWQAGLSRGGYGYFWVRGEGMCRAHRLALASVEEIDPSLVVDHLCMNKRCVNPDHLEQVTVRENVVRFYESSSWERPKECPSGHEYSIENTYLHPSGQRFCRTCKREKARAAYKPRSRQRKER